ncbi:MAG TPA: helix-turn-helix domain-containing protein [Candidatus Methylomirabilis sp.]
MKRKMSKPYLTIEETAVTLRVSERTVRRWIARGIVAARKIAGTVRVAREAIVEGG